MDSYGLLVVLLTLTLTIFLVAAIVLLVQLIRISRSVRNVTDKVESVANSLASAAQFVKPATISAALMRFVKQKSKARKGEEE